MQGGNIGDWSPERLTRFIDQSRRRDASVEVEHVHSASRLEVGGELALSPQAVEYVRNQLVATDSWHDGSLLNSWAAWGAPYAAPGYRKLPSGLVVLRGVAKSGTMSQPIFTLPAGYRPAYELICATWSNSAFGSVVVQTDGDVIANAGSNASFVLDQIVFVADQ